MRSRASRAGIARMTRPAGTRIGCAGWSIGTPQRALFGDGASMLVRYATRFDMA